MSVESAYDFPLPGFWSDRAVTEQVCDIGGKRCLLRQLGDYLLYRMADNDRVEHTLFVPYRGSGTRQYSKEVFANQIGAGENGRVALYSCPQALDCSALLLFRQNKTGFFLDYQTANGYSAHIPTEQVDFSWNGLPRGIASGKDILTVKWPQLEALCGDVFTAQVWPRMKNPFVRAADLRDARLAWKCGSQEELARLTHCIFHTQPGDWAELEAQDGRAWLIKNHCIPLTYKADMPQRPGGPPKYGVSRIRALCRLAFQYNTFTGHEWKYQRYANRERRKSYKATPLELTCRIGPPSAHERAEALLTLWEWLEGKVKEKQRRVYCGMD